MASDVMGCQGVGTPHEKAAVAKDGPPFTALLIGYHTRSGARAVCLELGLVVERPTLHEAVQELCVLVQDYLGEAAESGHYDAFVPRPAPFRAHLHTFWMVGRAVMGELLMAFLRRFRLRSGSNHEPNFVAQACWA